MLGFIDIPYKRRNTDVQEFGQEYSFIYAFIVDMLKNEFLKDVDSDTEISSLNIGKLGFEEFSQKIGTAINIIISPRKIRKQKTIRDLVNYIIKITNKQRNAKV